MNIQDENTKRILHIDSSSRRTGSNTRALTRAVIDQLHESQLLNVTERDVALGLPFIDETWVGANFTPADKRDTQQNSALALSDSLINELENNDVIVIGAPIYNFSVPATLKAWIDLVARVGKTFRYTDNGPVGLLENKKAIVVIASGGTQIGSDIDFASGYLRHVLGFIGIHDIEIINAEQFDSGDQQAQSNLQRQINSAVNKIAIELNTNVA